MDLDRRRNKLEGKIFNNIHVLSFINMDKGCAKYLAKCHCGKEFITRGTRLSKLHTKSCGCLKHKSGDLCHTSLPHGEASFNDYIYNYKTDAKNRGYEFKLSRKEFRDIISKNCFYCNEEPSPVSRRKNRFNGIYIGNGIDRVDNNKGYTLDNCVSCCTMCNQLKKNYSLTDFLEKITKIYKHTVLK